MDKNLHYINSTPYRFKTEVTLLILYIMIISYTYQKREKLFLILFLLQKKQNKK